MRWGRWHEQATRAQGFRLFKVVVYEKGKKGQDGEVGMMVQGVCEVSFQGQRVGQRDLCDGQ